MIKCCTCATGSISSSLAAHACSASLTYQIHHCDILVCIHIYCMLSDKMLHMRNRLQRFHLKPLNNNTVLRAAVIWWNTLEAEEQRKEEKKSSSQRSSKSEQATPRASELKHEIDYTCMYVRTYNFMYVYIIIITMWRVIIYTSKELNKTLHMRTMLQIFQK